ncbi:uncharacterized protein LOC124951269 isoform X2 [Vespa velutina]|uniref:uncharacterized protein LOC124951269 isoform X2 n=2 Tax=Vespa velutina TaxID=202808 RepID=UPI001FB2F5B4|nr:uncharacterized protein LOC124951269 isoform X2 [Vespa velutina]
MKTGSAVTLVTTRFHRRSPQRVTVHGHSMFRLVDRPLSFRQRANEWIYKEPAADPRTSPWFAWFATAVILWRCRRRITKAILAVSPFRLLKRRMLVALLKGKTSSVVMKPMRTTTMTNMATATTTATATTMTTTKMKQQHGILLGHYCNRQLQQLQEHNCKTTTGIKTRVKRLCTGDGPYVSPSSSSTQTNHQINYRVTRSGRIYGKYHNRIVSTELR